MTEQKHTEGPWLVCAERPNEIITKDGFLVATVDTDSAINDETVLEDARLIAVAPEMLEALQGIVPILADIGYFEGTDPAYAARNADSLGKRIISDRQRAVNACWDAIAKATGGSNA